MGVPGFEQGPETQRPEATTQVAQESLKLTEESGPPEAVTLPQVAGSDLSVCSVCLDQPPEVVMVPCGHIYACDKCGKQLHECALCREPVSQVLRVYYSANHSR